MNCTCEKCMKSMAETQFYTYKDGSKYKLCKKCLTMHVDTFDPQTFLWILKDADVPYIEEEFNNLRDKAFAKDPYKMNHGAVVGKYLSKMKLKQWKEDTWADTEKYKELAEKRKAALREAGDAAEERNAALKEAFEKGEISEAEYKTFMSTEVLNEELPPMNPYEDAVIGQTAFNENLFMDASELPDPAAELTHDDKIALAMKWGTLYKPNEWIELERNYREMENSFDIQDADTMNTLILLCKTNLKANQAIDCGDVDGFQKLTRVSDTLRKSAKFTAAQNKEEKNNFVDSVGEIVALCEKEGFIPRFAIDIPNDKVDKTLKDMNEYVRKLVTQDLGFGQQIEDAIKKLQLQKEEREREDDDFDFEDEDELLDDDYADYFEEIQEQKEKDLKTIMGEDE